MFKKNRKINGFKIIKTNQREDKNSTYTRNKQV